MKPTINHRQLIFAREYRGYSQTDLASQIKGLSQSNLSKFEKGIGLISDDLFQRIINFLDFPEKFFTEHIVNNAENAHFRKRANLSKKEILMIENSTKLIGYIIDQMSLSVEYPNNLIRSIDVEEGFSPETIAKFIRKNLGLQDNPVRDIIGLMEKNGIIVVELETNCEEFDGVSFMTDNGYSVIIINKSFSNDRKRFTIAHELGHLIMHSTSLIPDYRNKEDEANKFASEFLMPEIAIKNSLHRLRLSHLTDLKRVWLTSMASILRRAKDLGCISLEKYKNFNIEMSRNGYRKNEPVNVYIDEPSIFSKAYKLHKEELNYSNEELSNAFSLPIDVIHKFFNLNQTGPRLKYII